MLPFASPTCNGFYPPENVSVAACVKQNYQDSKLCSKNIWYIVPDISSNFLSDISIIRSKMNVSIYVGNIDVKYSNSLKMNRLCWWHGYHCYYTVLIMHNWLGRWAPSVSTTSFPVEICMSGIVQGENRGPGKQRGTIFETFNPAPTESVIQTKNV